MRAFRLAGIAAAVAAASAFWLCTGCSGDKNLDPTLEGNLLRYNEQESVTFSISGEATCSRCASVEVTGLLVELTLKEDPTRVLTMDVFDGLGDFSFPRVTAAKGGTLQVSGTLYFGGDVTRPGFEAVAEAAVPGDDDETLSVVLNF